MTTYTIKPNELEAIHLAASTEETRYYLNGVYIEPNEDGTVALIATDGHRMASLRSVASNPTKDAFILSSGDIKKILSMVKVDIKGVSKNLKDMVEIQIKKDSENLTLSSVLGIGEEPSKIFGSFTAKEVDGTFPDYRRVVPDTKEETADADLSFNTDYVDSFGKMAKLITGNKSFPQIAIKSSGRANPIRVTIPDNTEFLGVLMPMRA